MSMRVSTLVNALARICFRPVKNKPSVLTHLFVANGTNCIFLGGREGGGVERFAKVRHKPRR